MISPLPSESFPWPVLKEPVASLFSELRWGEGRLHSSTLVSNLSSLHLSTNYASVALGYQHFPPFQSDTPSKPLFHGSQPEFMVFPGKQPLEMSRRSWPGLVRTPPFHPVSQYYIYRVTTISSEYAKGPPWVWSPGVWLNNQPRKQTRTRTRGRDHQHHHSPWLTGFWKTCPCSHAHMHKRS